MKRSCGVILPLAAVAGEYGIGTMGGEAYRWLDFLQQAGQSWWQLLPLTPIGGANSPYYSPSAFAGETLYLDLPLLAEDGLLTVSELDGARYEGDAGLMDYDWLRRTRYPLLARACRRCRARYATAVDSFAAAHDSWLPDYALFTALHRRYPMQTWQQWPQELRLRDPVALAAAQRELQAEIDEEICGQFLFFRQWSALRAYARKRGVSLIGDLPLYVAPDAADVWANQAMFQLDAEGQPLAVAGAPPDAFNTAGQLWGNPLYDWERLAADGYGWWLRRVDLAGQLYDMLRLDHFRGLESYWSIPAGSSASAGKWQRGPGLDFTRVLREWFPHLRFMAEDLGDITDAVRVLRQQSDFPGMKVLQFAFLDRYACDYLPHNYEHDCVCYTGTHDNDTLAGWLHSADAAQLAYVRQYFGLNAAEGETWGVLRGAYASPADLCMVQMQDILELDSTCRTNTPGTISHNWEWRMVAAQLDPTHAARLCSMAQMYGRA